MTTTPPTPDDPTADGPHLDDEAISAALDGEATADEAAHLTSCATCQGVLDGFRRVQAAVAVSVPVDDAAREAALTAALDAFDASAPARSGTSRTVGGADELAGRRARRRVPPAWLGAAALVVVAAVAVPLLTGGEDDAADERAGGEVALDAPTDSGLTESFAVAPPVDVGDLGTLEPGADLRPIVDGALGPPATGDAEDGDGTVGGDAVTESEEEAPAPAGSSSPAPGSTGSSGAGSSGAGGSAAGGGSAGDAGEAPAGSERSSTCEPAVRAELPDAGALLLVGTATVEGADALVYGFAAPTERPTVLLAVVRADGCGLLTFQSYARG